jgi:hypothetical protein
MPEAATAVEEKMERKEAIPVKAERLVDLTVKGKKRR